MSHRCGRPPVRSAPRTSTTLFVVGFILMAITSVAGGALVWVTNPKDQVLSVSIYVTVLAGVLSFGFLIAGGVSRDNENRR